jgi:hypothetical protein
VSDIQDNNDVKNYITYSQLVKFYDAGSDLLFTKFCLFSFLAPSFSHVTMGNIAADYFGSM